MGGVESLVGELRAHSVAIDDFAAQADIALLPATGALTSAPLAGAVERLAARSRGGLDDDEPAYATLHGVRITITSVAYEHVE